jgi:hypothetical protein
MYTLYNNIVSDTFHSGICVDFLGTHMISLVLLFRKPDVTMIILFAPKIRWCLSVLILDLLTTTAQTIFKRGQTRFLGAVFETTITLCPGPSTSSHRRRASTPPCQVIAAMCAPPCQSCYILAQFPLSMLFHALNVGPSRSPLWSAPRGTAPPHPLCGAPAATPARSTPANVTKREKGSERGRKMNERVGESKQELALLFSLYSLSSM